MRRGHCRSQVYQSGALLSRLRERQRGLLIVYNRSMTARKRTDAEEPADLPEDRPEYDFGGLGTMIAREVAIEARRSRARREFFRIEHVMPSADHGRWTMDDGAEQPPKSKA